MTLAYYIDHILLQYHKAFKNFSIVQLSMKCAPLSHIKALTLAFAFAFAFAFAAL
jgi:hypothetical protein